MSNMDADTSTTAPELRSPMQAASPPVFEDRMSISSPLSSPVYKEPSVALDDPFMSSLPITQGSSPTSTAPRLDLRALLRRPQVIRRRPLAVNEVSPTASSAYQFDRSTPTRAPRVYQRRPLALADRSSFDYPNTAGEKTKDLNFTPSNSDCSAPTSPLFSPTSSLFSPTNPNASVDGPDDSDNSSSVDGPDDPDDDSTSVSLSQPLGNAEFDASFNDSDSSDHASAASTNQRIAEIESPLDGSDSRNVLLFNSSGSWRRSMSSTPQASVPSTPSRPRKVYVLYSACKKQSQPSPAAKTKDYSPQGLLRNMDAWGIEPIDPENEAEILQFFLELGKLRGLVKSRNKSLDKQPGSIPGYDSILDNWVTQYAVGAIPSREAVSVLEGKVSLDFHRRRVLSFITSTLVKIQSETGGRHPTSSYSTLALVSTLEG
jgi:hypothetical protein